MDIHAVGRGVATRNKRRACSRALRSHRPRVHELYAVSGQTVRIGGVYILVAVTTELVSAGIFEGEPKDIGPFVFFCCLLRPPGPYATRRKQYTLIEVSFSCYISFY